VTTIQAVKAAAREPRVQPLPDGQAALQRWDLPTEAGFLKDFLFDVFTTYWADITWGPLNEGASFELLCPSAPTETSYDNGYLTIGFDGSHFHICLAPGATAPATPEAAAALVRRLPGEAWIFRQLDRDGAPVAWGFEMRNGAGAPMLTVFFASPFVSRATVLETEPKWERLVMWRDISRRYLGRGPEAFDESGPGYTRMAR
jgi:hypothetical protein